MFLFTCRCTDFLMAAMFASPVTGFSHRWIRLIAIWRKRKKDIAITVRPVAKATVPSTLSIFTSWANIPEYSTHAWYVQKHLLTKRTFNSIWKRFTNMVDFVCVHSSPNTVQPFWNAINTQYIHNVDYRFRNMIIDTSDHRGFLSTCRCTEFLMAT